MGDPIPKKLSQRDWLKVFGVVGASLATAGCQRLVDERLAEQAVATHTAGASSAPVDQRPSATATRQNSKVQSAETSTPSKVEIQNASDLFTFGGRRWDAPFTIVLPKETAVMLGYGGTQVYHEDIPLPLTTQYFSSQQNEVMHAAGKDNSGGNPFMLFRTDMGDKMFGLMMHSLEDSSGGMINWYMGKAVAEKRMRQFTGKHIGMVFADDPNHSVIGEIVWAKNIPAAQFELGKGVHYAGDLSVESVDLSSWGYYDNTPLFARTDVLDVPDEIRNDQTPGVYYVMMVACNSEQPGTVFHKAGVLFDDEKNEFYRTLLVLRVTSSGR